MRKRRLICLILSFIALIVLTALSLTYDNPFLFILLMILVLILNNVIKNKERQITNDIIARYGQECDPFKYIEELNNYANKCFLTKKQKLLYNLYYSLAYLDAGDFDNVKNRLLEIDNQSNELDEVMQILYLKAWCDYFFYNNLDEKMKFTLLKMRDLITNSNNKALKNNYSIIYMLLEAKYYIVSGVHLDKAKELLKNRKVLIPTKLSLISSNYQMALLDIKEGNYLAAKDKLTVISSKNDKLYVVRKANQLLEEVNEKLNCNLS